MEARWNRPCKSLHWMALMQNKPPRLKKHWPNGGRRWWPITLEVVFCCVGAQDIGERPRSCSTLPLVLNDRTRRGRRRCSCTEHRCWIKTKTNRLCDSTRCINSIVLLPVREITPHIHGCRRRTTRCIFNNDRYSITVD